MAWWFPVVDIKGGGTKESSSCHGIWNRVVRGSQPFFCGKGVVGWKLIYHPRGRVYDFVVYDEK